jgi:DNA-binding NarL/FixJ family response regulator
MTDRLTAQSHNSAIKVHLVDDQELIRRGMASLLSFSDKINVTGQSENGEECIQQLNSRQVDADVVLLDIRMPKCNGIEVLEYLQENSSALKCIILTTFDDHQLVLSGMRAGAKGYLLKDISLEKLVEAIAAVEQGGTALSPELTQYLIQNIHSQAPPIQDPLTPKEHRVLALMAKGLSNKELAIELCNAEGTIRNQVSQILSKLDVRDRTQAILKAIELGLISA